MSYMKVVAVGNLGRDPEMRYTPSGKPVTNFSIAVNNRWTGEDGEKHEETTWLRVSAWGRLAEVANEYLTKGRQVLIEGRLRADPETGGPRVYQKKDGSFGASYEITASRIVFLGGGNGGGSAPEAPSDEGDEGESDPIPF